RLLHAVELLNEKILLLTTSLFREDYRAIGASNYASVFGISASQGVKTVALQDYLVREMNYVHKMDEPQSTHVFSPPGP
ncbi:hypothetical protein, partial [Burkholderia multivorans]|uniref:hypothetical protein n=1 Tax=Burkholderia multivorans TaxID=87883 RepID=UPI001C615C22